MPDGGDERWLVTGGTGQVGLALQRRAPAKVRIWAPRRDEIDLAKLPDLAELVIRERVSAIVNCGAYTAVDRAESEPELAHAVNADAPERLAKTAAEVGIPIVQLSTDYVFPAEGGGPWREDDPIAPASVYGRTKAEGEAAVRRSGARHAIVRTAWVISEDGNNFVKTMLRLGAEQSLVRVIADQVGTPTHAGDLADAVARMTARFTADRAQTSGTWHCANAGETSWHGLASHVFACAATLGAATPAQVSAITTAEHPTPARRPRDSRLDTKAIARDFGIRLRPWQKAVAEIVDRLVLKEVRA